MLESESRARNHKPLIWLIFVKKPEKNTFADEHK